MDDIDSMGPGLQLVGARFFNFVVRHAAIPTRTVYVDINNLDPIQGQGQDHGPFELPTIAHNCTFLGLSPPSLSREGQN